MNRVLPIGLPNFGNTCWFNSLLQALASSKNFCLMLANLSISGQQPFTEGLEKVMACLLSNDMFNCRSVLLNFLRGLNWSKGMPEDSSEAFLWLVECLHNEHSKTSAFSEHPIMIELNKHNSNKTSPIYQLAQGCAGWKTSDKEQRYEPFLTFFLEWAEVENGMQNITKCLEKTFASKQIVMMPRMLVICFDRCPSHIRFIVTQQFSLYTPDNKTIQYSLKAMVIHIGSLAGGHYVSYGNRNGEWYIFDDDRVSKILQHNIVLNDVPRLLIYDVVSSL